MAEARRPEPDGARLRRLKERLLKERERILNQIGTMEIAEGESGLSVPHTDSVGELSAYDNHPADLGTELFARSLDIGLRDSQRILLAKIADALKAMDDGTYGVCSVCGKPIDDERLEAIPYATLCVDCKTEEEARGFDRRSRPIEERAIGAPWSDVITEGIESPAYDGEDTWQEVAMYGTASSPQDVPESLPTLTSYKAFIDPDERVGGVEDVDFIIDEEDHDDIPDPSETDH